MNTYEVTTADVLDWLGNENSFSTVVEILTRVINGKYNGFNPILENIKNEIYWLQVDKLKAVKFFAITDWVDSDIEFKEKAIEYYLAKQFLLDLNPNQPESYFQDNWLNRPHAPGWNTEPRHSDYDVMQLLRQVTQRHIVNNQALGQK